VNLKIDIIIDITLYFVTLMCWEGWNEKGTKESIDTVWCYQDSLVSGRGKKRKVSILHNWKNIIVYMIYYFLLKIFMLLYIYTQTLFITFYITKQVNLFLFYVIKRQPKSNLISINVKVIYKIIAYTIFSATIT